MKKLQDYKDAEAIEVWAEMIEPASKIMQDEKVKSFFETDENGKMIAKPMDAVQYILKEHAQEIAEVLLVIDPTPLTGTNSVVRALDLVLSIVNDKDTADFFGSLGGVDLSGFSGGATESTKEEDSREIS